MVPFHFAIEQISIAPLLRLLERSPASFSQEFIAGAEKLGCLLDDLTAGWPARELAPLEALFLTSSRYEYLFWEMAWTQSSWPV
jgi:hypothetical protein